MRHRLALTSTLILVVLAPPVAEAATRPRLTAFQSCTGLLKYVRAHAEKTPHGGPVFVSAQPVERDVSTDGGSEDAPTPSAAPQSAAGAAPAHSQTNVQEAGVDEPDLVKTDGRHLFTVRGERLHAIATQDLRITGTVALPAGGEHQLFLHGDRVLVLSSGYVYSDPPRPMPSDGPAGAAPSMPPPYGRSETTLTLVDVSDPAAMRVTRTLVAEGRLVDARLTGASARVVIDATPRALQEPTPDAVAAAPARRWLPRGTLRRGIRGRRTFMRLADCDEVRRPPTFSGLDALTVLTIDVERGLMPVDSDAVLTSSDTVYASTDSMYLATQRWDQRETTLLHKLDVSKPDATVYRASGSVEGSLLNQFALSEHAGVLRAATTAFDRRESESFVTTLAERDGRLAQVGKVGGLGRDERIYSVRFIGDQGYVVTFRQTDPLYTLDLSDPAAPRVVGELKILGYSAYLHPVGDDLLLGIGQDATEEGRTLGVQLSLFDVRDPRNPVRLHQRRLGDRFSSSEAEYSHHAFLWWPATRLAVLPVSTGRGESAAFGLRVSRDGIADAGRIEHGAQDRTVPIQRSVVAGERLLTLSMLGVKSNRLDTFADVAWLPFAD